MFSGKRRFNIYLCFSDLSRLLIFAIDWLLILGDPVGYIPGNLYTLFFKVLSLVFEKIMVGKIIFGSSS